MPFRSLSEYKETAQTLNCKGFELSWWQHKNAEAKTTILFIHGFPSASWDWHFQWHALKDQYNLIAMDMLGYGISDKPVPYNYKLVEQAQFYVQLLESLDVKDCHILAHDYGDSVAQELLYLYHTKKTPFKINSVTFLNGGLFSEVHRPLLTQKLLKSVMGPILIPFLNRSSLKRSFENIFGPQTPPTVEDIDVLWELLLYKQGTKAMPFILQYLDERRVRREDWLNAMQQTAVWGGR